MKLFIVSKFSGPRLEKDLGPLKDFSESSFAQQMLGNWSLLDLNEEGEINYLVLDLEETNRVKNIARQLICDRIGVKDRRGLDTTGWELVIDVIIPQGVVRVSASENFKRDFQKPVIKLQNPTIGFMSAENIHKIP